MKKTFLIAGLIAGLTATDGYAKKIPVKTQCPAGCFCLNGGVYDAHGQAEQDASMCDDASARLRTSAYQLGTAYYCSGIVVANDANISADYYYDDFSEFYDSFGYGFYGFINEQFTYGNSCQSGPEGSLYNFDGIFLCPETHPNSEPGAKALTECFKYNANGKKIYYSKPIRPVPVAPVSSKKKKYNLERSAQTPRMVKKIVYEQVVEEDEE